MNILIIEDERPAARHLRRITESLKPGASFSGPLESVEESVQWLKTNPSPDLIFCDIRLSDGLSFEIFDQIGVASPVIFTTAYDQFAIRAFKLNSIDYLLKPIDPDELGFALKKLDDKLQPGITPELLKSLLHLNASQNSYKSRFMVKTGDTIKSIQTSEVAFFSSSDKVTFLHTVSGKRHIIDYPLNELESLLNPSDFFRLNRGYIASIASIEDVLQYSGSRLRVKLSSCPDDSILISRKRAEQFKKWMDS